MSALTRLLRNTPLLRYIEAVKEGTRQQSETVEHQETVADIHYRRLQYYYEKNHFTPLVVGLISGKIHE